MCGRFTLATPLDVLMEIFKIQELDGAYQPRCNIAPTQMICVLRDRSPKRLELLRWGLIPFWASGPEIGNRLINARCETVAQKPSYRRAFRQQRCLVLADGFYEWKKVGRERLPFLFRRADRRPFAFAGIWESWTPKPGKTAESRGTQGGRDLGNGQILSACLLTTDANPLVEPIHERMPVILQDEGSQREWLGGAASEGRTRELCQPLSVEGWVSYRVDKRVNRAGYEDASCMEALDEDA